MMTQGAEVSLEYFPTVLQMSVCFHPNQIVWVSVCALENSFFPELSLSYNYMFPPPLKCDTLEAYPSGRRSPTEWKNETACETSAIENVTLGNNARSQ